MQSTFKGQKGFSLVEILIAVSIMLVALSSVVLVSFGDQSFLGQSRTSEDALAQAQILLSREESNAQQDFRLVDTIASTSDGIVETSATIRDWPNDPYATKEVEVDASWPELGLMREVSLSELVSDYEDPNTLDTCDTALNGNWKTPISTLHTFVVGDLLPLTVPIGHSFSSSNPVVALDAYHGILYVGDASTSLKSNDSFFTFDVTHPPSARYLGSIDTNTASIDGTAAIVVAGKYAYLANPHTADFRTCKSGSASCAQLQILSVANPASMPAPFNYELPTSTAPYVTGSSGQAVGKSIAYSKGYVYLGLTKSATGPEFDIIDVSSSTNPQWAGGYSVGAGVSAISVRGSYAYLATDRKSDELVILDVSNPSAPILAGSYNVVSASGWGDGESVYQRGLELYLGLTYATGSPEIYTLDVSKPSVPSLVSAYVAGSSVVGEFARDSLLFALTSTSQQLQILDASNTTTLVPYTNATTIPATGTVLDCEGNYFYAGSNGSVSIIGPGS